MILILKNAGEGACFNLTLPNGDPFVMSEGVAVDTTDAIGTWLVENYSEYVTTATSEPAAKPETEE